MKRIIFCLLIMLFLFGSANAYLQKDCDYRDYVIDLGSTHSNSYHFNIDSVDDLATIHSDGMYLGKYNYMQTGSFSKYNLSPGPHRFTIILYDTGPGITEVNSKISLGKGDIQHTWNPIFFGNPTGQGPMCESGPYQRIRGCGYGGRECYSNNSLNSMAYTFCVIGEEICNNIDDDCDGVIDNITENCGVNTNIGLCKKGTRTCTSGQWSSCSGSVSPSTEECDGQDNDCDGSTDNGTLSDGTLMQCIKGSNNCTNNCLFATRTISCSGTTKPSNSTWNYGTTNGKFTQEWNGSSWIPTSKNYFYSSTEAECAWKCDSGFYYYNGECRSDTQEANCSGSLPNNAVWNDGGQNGKFRQLCSGGTCSPTSVSAAYSETSGECKWDCGQGYHYSSGQCISDEKLANCNLSDFNGSLPENATWNNIGNEGKFIQKWVNDSWTPTTKKAFYTENILECAFKCKLPYRDCDLDESVYCGAGTQNCKNGFWGDCEKGTSVACSANQYCDGADCQFCEEGTKNCDLNLLNGCETNILFDEENCGSCGSLCFSGQSCIEGECVGEIVVDQNLSTSSCENVTCGENETCLQDLGICSCDFGYNDCDFNEMNGCETLGNCSQEVVDEECSIDSDCREWESCIDGKCEEPTLDNPCDFDAECNSTESCQGGFCIPLICSENEIATEHFCVCPGEVCGDKCYSSEGICCNDFWNEGINTCGYSTDEAEEKATQSGNQDAQKLINQAKASIGSGNILKGKTEAMLSELRSDIDLSGKTNFEEAYLEAKTALDNGEYQRAQELIISTNDELDSSGDYTILLVAGFVIILVALLAYWFYFKRQIPEIIDEEYE